MTLSEFLEQLNGVIFITCHPDVLDFTNSKRPASLVIYGESNKVSIPLNLTDSEFKRLLGQLRYYIARKGILVIGWDVKNFFSYIKGRNCNFLFESKLIDLFVLESYLDHSLDCPKSLGEAKVRLKSVFKYWDKVGSAYTNVYLPLILEVLPGLETTGLNDLRLGRGVYSNYRIEGQMNGRLATSKYLTYSYTPHSLDEDDKKNLLPREYDCSFMYFDYKNMEVSALYWLSKDSALGQILFSDDVYSEIWKRITGIPSNKRYREICKLVFLPVMYGQGYRSLARSLKVSESTAKKLFDGIHNIFHGAISWLTRCQESIRADFYTEDYYGRRRKFETEQYKVRNFCIQSPAALICLHKLVKLYELSKKNRDLFKVIFHVHDGYGLLVKNKYVSSVQEMVTYLLEQEDTMYPGLILKTRCHVWERIK